MISLDKRFLHYLNKNSNRKEEIPALDSRWMKKVQFVMYQAPPINMEAASLEEWKERLSFIQDDLQWLLEQSHEQFWCQIIFDESFHRCLDSYLQSAPRIHDRKYNLPTDIERLHNNVHRLVFMACLRMSTHKESKEHFLTPSVFGDILYENFIFDIPKLMDLCALYGTSNGQLLSKMLGNIFQQQARYEDDLHAAANTVIEVLNTIQKKCGIRVESGTLSPQKLSDSRDKKHLEEMAPEEFTDLVYYLLDTGFTLTSFLEVYPTAARVFAAKGLPIKLATCYEQLVPRISAVFQEKMKGNLACDELLGKLHKAFKLLLTCFHLLVFHAYLQPVFETRQDEEVAKFIESYMNVFAAILGEKRFLADLESYHPFAEDRDVLTQANYQVDETRLSFIDDAIREALSMYGRRKREKGQVTKISQEEPSYEVSDNSSEADVSESYAIGGAAPPAVTGVALDSMISSVKDLLPELGDGFIQLCLEEYNYEVEKVVNAVLEDKLLPSLEDLDRAMPREEEPSKEEPLNLVDRRANIFDNDEFDVFHQQSVDTSKIHKGKKIKTKGMGLLDDKAELETFKNVYDKHGHEFEEDYFEEDYEDEYDDTYDSQAVGAKDEDSADELIVRRPLNVHKAAGPRWKTEEDEEDGDRPPRDEFVQNPALLRERAEMRWQSQQRRKPARTHDVKGNAKGQGQEQETVRNRAWKEKNKATRVHHNRRALADKKRKV